MNIFGIVSYWHVRNTICRLISVNKKGINIKVKYNKFNKIKCFELYKKM